MGTIATGKGNKRIQQLINWFEIPVLDINRAADFYSYILGIELERVELPEYSLAIFPQGPGIGGALIMGQGCEPSESGALVYLNSTNNIQSVLEKIDKAGGRVILEKTKINEENGYFALFIDTEGNRLALNSKS